VNGRLVQDAVTTTINNPVCCRTSAPDLTIPLASAVNTIPSLTTATSCSGQLNYTSKWYQRLSCPVICMLPYKACASAPQRWKI